jgi:arylsulfatase A-like enzyme
MRSTGHIILACIVFASSLLACRGQEENESIRERIAQLNRPNVVLVVIDTLRADAISPYGYDARVSPTLERLAKGGIVFERVLAQSSWTKVSMASLLTSLWPRTHGVREPTDGLAEQALTLQDVLRGAGYRTYAVQSNGWLEQSFGFHHGFDHYVFPHATTMAGQLGSSSVWPHGERIFAEAERLLNAHETGTPFFLYLHFMDVHEYAAPPEFKRFGDDQRAAYAAAILWVDDVLRRLIDRISDAGHEEGTILVVASDHGEAFGENQVFGHALNVHTPVLRVPLIIKLPFDMREIRIPSQVRNLDIAPTILELVGVPVPPSFEGESLLSLIDQDTKPPDRMSFASLGSKIMHGASEQVSVNDGAFSLVRTFGDEKEDRLFDQATDPLEDANMLEFEREEAVRMQGLLDAHLAHDAQSDVVTKEVRIDPGIANRLKALGYLQ